MRRILLIALAVAVCVAAVVMVSWPREPRGDVPGAVSVPVEAALSQVRQLPSTTTPAQEQAIAALLESAKEVAKPAGVTIDYPLNEAVFPPGLPPPTFAWHDSADEADTWLVDVAFGRQDGHIYVLTGAEVPLPAPELPPAERPKAARDYKPSARQRSARRWRPDGGVWAAIQRGSAGSPARVTVFGFNRKAPHRILSRGSVTLETSTDPVAAPIFYRDVPLPFIHAFNNLTRIRWRLGDVTSETPPPVLLTDMKVCGNCHSFTPDGKTMAMDVDYGNDKGSYVIAAIQPETVLSAENVISWSDYKREEGDLTFGLLSQISPDGRYVLSTVKDRAVFSPVEDLFYSQRFFPIKGIVLLYDRQTKGFAPLSGADDPRWVQSNPTWSPDGKTVLFVRAKAHELKGLKDRSAVLVKREEAREFFEGGRKLRYDIYHVPFRDGKGGQARPLRGASANGKSNYFPRFSPDGRWIVFCRADSFMLLQPDSTLYILPAGGGTPRKMRCNLPGKMNSWHSFSPNGRWLVFASKANGPYTQLWVAHVGADGTDAPPVLLERFTAADRAANIPEFVNVSPDRFARIRQEFADYHTHYRIARKHEGKREYPQAMAELKKVLAEKPDHADAAYLLASCLARTGKEPEAVAHARRALEADADHWRARRLLGGIYSRDGRYRQALRHLELVLKARPGDALTMNNLAWMLATCPDPAYRNGARAVELARRACEATDHTVPPMLDSLAAAYAEAGQFDPAVRTLEKALVIVRRRPGASTKELEFRLKLYRDRRPYREGPPPR